MSRPRLAVLISGRGRNLEAISQAVGDGRIPAELVLVLCNVAGAAGLEYARAQGLPVRLIEHRHYASRAEFDAALAAALRESGADIIALAGFMRVLGADFVREFEGRLLNVHPSLLPKHAGLHTHRRALEDGDAEHGATVHYVTERLDGGPPIIQGRLSVQAQDDEQTLATRVLEQIELKIYPQAIAWVARGELQWRDNAPCWRGAALSAPLSMHDLEPGFL